MFFFDKLGSLGYDKSRIALCKETRSLWKELGMKPEVVYVTVFGRVKMWKCLNCGSTSVDRPNFCKKCGLVQAGYRD